LTKQIGWQDGIPKGWLPIQIGTYRQYCSVRWMQASPESLMEPFFEWTVGKLRGRYSPVRELETELNVLVDGGRRLPFTVPAGLIFHMSRCGSTLLLNALKTTGGVIGLSEAQPMLRAMHLASAPSAHWAQAGKHLATSLVNVIAHSENGPARQVIYKGTMSDILCLTATRAIWPHVPCIILIRDPMEVMVSNLQQRPMLLLEWTSGMAECPFGPPPSEVLGAGVEEFWAWVIGRFCLKALEVMDDACTVIDYEDLTPSTIRVVGSRFNLKMDAGDEDRLRETLLAYSKSPGRPYTNDREVKQQGVTPAVRASADKWIVENYKRLKDCSRRMAFK